MSRDTMEPLTILNAHGDELRVVDADADEIAALGLTGERALLIDVTEGTVAMAAIDLDVDGATQLRDALTAWLDDAIPPNVLAFVAANLPAFDAMARLAVFGASKHPGGALGPDGIQTYADHLAHASAHLARARKGEERDTETGELHVAHAATRLVYAIGMIASGDERRNGGR